MPIGTAKVIQAALQFQVFFSPLSGLPRYFTRTTLNPKDTFSKLGQSAADYSGSYFHTEKKA